MASAKRPLAATAVGFLCAFAACGRPREGGQEFNGPTNALRYIDAPYVVLVSFDGFAWDLMEKHSAPNFEQVAAEGVRAERMIPTFPTKTFPAHYSIATGMYAETHGLVGNRFWAPDKQAYYSIGDRVIVEDGSWYRGEPIWVTAERQGMVSASFFFVGSEADVGGVRPSYWHRFDASISHEDRVDGVLDWLSMPKEARPHMLTLYFEDIDAVAHSYALDSPETGEAVARVDASLGRLLDGLDALEHGRDVYLVLVSDHGMMVAPASKVDILDMELFPGVRLVDTGPYASLFIDEGGPARGLQVRDSIAALMPLNEVWLREDIPVRLHYRTDPRVGDIVISAAPERRIGSASRTPRDTYTHGWDNAVREMGAIFIARGPGIGAGQSIPAFESVHVYPFLAHVLGLTPNPAIDGDLGVLLPILGNQQN
jgi:alkaline phosphatase D